MATVGQIRLARAWARYVEACEMHGIDTSKWGLVEGALSVRPSDRKPWRISRGKRAPGFQPDGVLGADPSSAASHLFFAAKALRELRDSQG